MQLDGADAGSWWQIAVAVAIVVLLAALARAFRFRDKLIEAVDERVHRRFPLLREREINLEMVIRALLMGVNFFVASFFLFFTRLEIAAAVGALAFVFTLAWQVLRRF
jgi:hypothetical protein